MKKKNNFEDEEEQKLSVRENNEDEESENSETIEELEEIVSRTPAPTPVSQRVLQRQTTNSSLEMSEEPQLETQLQNTPTTQTRTETDNSPRYVSNAPSYSASTSYATARGDYEEAGYPKQIEIRNIRTEQPTPFITPTPFETSQIRQPIVKPWMDPIQTSGPSSREIEEKKYEPFSDSRRTKRRLL